MKKNDKTAHNTPPMEAARSVNAYPSVKSIYLPYSFVLHEAHWV
jgi:hypothetical protein